MTLGGSGAREALTFSEDTLLPLVERDAPTPTDEEMEMEADLDLLGLRNPLEPDPGTAAVRIDQRVVAVVGFILGNTHAHPVLPQVRCGAGGSSSWYPRASAQNRAIRSGSAQSIVIRNPFVVASGT